ncbi:hypothetical protein [Alicyclobacillus sp. ALC3]|uniref:hypothetical protein n=1 Tax=Alicyclobacillus sp. ALC3 TaxID=2796143 RepID=UPI0023785C44|nr:hypothetical protein [Alicyclobacillus sp. ALC3]WDL98490.1 hypothetical protein JC200_07365 [Alicyclobacillus sp. ALC3]
MYVEAYPDDESAQIRFHLGVINAFVNTIVAERDLILVEDKSDPVTYVGIAGEYEYVGDTESVRLGLTHRRHVDWRAKVPKSDLVPEVQELLRNRPTITQFKYPQSVAMLDWVFDTEAKLDGTADLVHQALEVLKDDMGQTEDPLRRTLAAWQSYANLRRLADRDH